MSNAEQLAAPADYSVDPYATIHAEPQTRYDPILEDSGAQAQDTRFHGGALENPEYHNGEIYPQKTASTVGPQVEILPQAESENDGELRKNDTFVMGHPSLSRKMTMHPHDTIFNPSKQAFLILKSGLTRLVITVVLIAAIMGLLKGYSSRQLLSKTDKRAFNALVTGLSIALGLNVASAMKSMAGNLRWKSMATGYMSPGEINLFLSIESVTKVFQLGLKVLGRRPFVALACLFWISISIAAQIGIATLGLTYSLDTATDNLMLQQGDVVVSNFTTFSAPNANANTSDPLVLRALAQASGQTALNAIPWRNTEPLPKGSRFVAPPKIYNSYTEPVYVMVDYSVDFANAVYTDRNVTASTTCQSYPVSSGANGDLSTVTFLKGEELQNLTVGVTGKKVTTFIATDRDCGSRCSSLSIFQSRDPQGDTNAATVFMCNVTLNEVTNTKHSVEQIPDELAKAATSGICGNSGFQPNGAVLNSASYASDLLPGLPSDNAPVDMELFLNLYVVGVIASADQTNDFAVVSGMTPVTANSLGVEWKTIWIIVSLLAGGHAILLVIFTTISSRVLIPHDNPLTHAKLLAPVVLAADAYKHHHGQGEEEPKFVYGHRENKNKDMQVEFGQDLQPLPFLGRWPSDWYEKAHL